MHHFVGCASNGWLYERADGDLHLSPEYVGQVIDLDPPGPYMAGAATQAPARDVPQTARSTAAPAKVQPALHVTPSARVIQGTDRALQLRTSPVAPGVRAPGAPPPWTNQGWYGEPGPLPYGPGYYMPGMVPGYVPWTSGMPSEEEQLAMQEAACPEWMAEACEILDQPDCNDWGADASTCCEGEQFAAGVTVAPWCVCRVQQCWQQKNAQAHHQQLLARRKAQQKASGTGGRSPAGGAGAKQGAGRYSGAHAQQQGNDNQAQQQQQSQQSQQGYCCYPQQGGYCCYPQQGYACPPGYGYPQQGYACPPGYYCCPQCGGWCCDGSDGEYAAGAAPAGLGSEIGGIAGAIGGTFFGSPEIGAPIGAALGGVIQGAACGNLGGAAHPAGGAAQRGGARTGQAKKSFKTPDGKTVWLTGTYDDKRLFVPDGEQQDPNAGPMANLVDLANAELGKLEPGTSFGRAKAGTPEGAAARAAMQQKKAPQTAAAGFYDLPRYATMATDWAGDQANAAADWVSDLVGGPTGEMEHVVSGSGASKAYGPYEASTVQNLLQQLPAAGMSVSGGNPYEIDTHSHGVTLEASWDGQYVHVTITGKNFYVSQGQVWDKLDGLMPQANA